MTKHRTATPMGLWSRTAQALGKLWAGVISLPDDQRRPAARAVSTDYPRFPPF
jgi:hypothetical protein